jgi:hypothetical protein
MADRFSDLNALIAALFLAAKDATRQLSEQNRAVDRLGANGTPQWPHPLALTFFVFRHTSSSFIVRRYSTGRALSSLLPTA